MLIGLAIISILAITGLIWFSNRVLPFKICPICAGVSGTWLWLLVVKFLGYDIDLVIIAMLMGGSVVGIAYQLEKRLSSNRFSLLWKTLFIPAGFVAVYSVILSWWPVFIATTIFLVAVALSFTQGLRSPINKSDKAVEELEKKMKECC